MIHQPNKDRTTTPPKKGIEELYEYLIAMEQHLFREGWEQARFVATAVINANRTKKEPYKKEYVLRFPWDKEDDNEKS